MTGPGHPLLGRARRHGMQAREKVLHMVVRMVPPKLAYVQRPSRLFSSELREYLPNNADGHNKRNWAQ